MSVNIGGASLVSEQFEQRVRAALDKYNIAAKTLEFEVSERSLLAQLDNGQLDLSWLDPLGIELLVDDFGSSYSNFMQLRRLPVRRLKIDGGFVRDLPQQPDGEAVTAAIIALGKSLDLEVIAGGIETEAQADYLSRFAGLKAQGFLYSEPLEMSELTNLSEAHLR
jgi:EAL domain-containing protein (putative c-di-GMP-specific phosphodiesterase class I)